MPLTAPWAKVTCPYCFERFPLRKAPRRLVGKAAAAPGGQQSDDVEGKFFGIVPGPMRGRVVEPAGGFKSLFYTPPENMDERLICPHCHILLPDKVASGEASGQVIAVVGARNSGKSNFFGVLIRQLRRRYTDEVGFDLMDADTYGPSGRVTTSNLYQERYGRYLFDPQRPTAVPQTVRAGGDRVTRDDPRVPLIYMLRFRKQGVQHVTRPLAHRVPVYFMVYDAAGEDMADQEAIEQYYRFILRATGIIFLIDPFDYPGIRSQLPAEVQKRLKPPMDDPAQVVDGVIRLFQNRGGRRAGGRLPVPVAFALTKSDLLTQAPGVVYDGSPLLRESRHTRGYDRPGGEAVHREVTECIRRWDSPELVRKAEENFTHHQFFALSALGSLPAERNELTRDISPTRIADPLLWLLWKNGFIPETKV